jgi:hypothetical protein
MIDISFIIDGQNVRPNEIKDALERAILSQVIDNIKHKLLSVRDKETGEHPKVIVKGNRLGELTFEVRGSEELVKEAMRALNS